MLFSWLRYTAVSFLLASPAMAATAPSFADMIEPRLSAVVNISTSQKINRPQAQLPFDPSDPRMAPFRDLLEQFQQQQGGPSEATSLGSGFVIDPEGYVVTNNHVVTGADKIFVTFVDDTKLPARIIGRDEKTDLALLKVESKTRLSSVKFGNSDNVRVGDWVVAVGNPFGLGGSVSAGIVSARSRNINAGPFDDFIQTDAAINRGNSGGPLFNEAGEVVGINSAIFSPTGANVGIGFAVPSSMAEPIIEQLRDKGHAERAWLGVKIQEVSEEIADAMGLGKPRGALVLDIDPSGPAKGTGLQSGDVIVQFDGTPVKKMRDLPRAVAETKIGKQVPVVVWRAGAEKTYSITLGKLPEVAAKADVPKTRGVTPGRSPLMLGMEVAPLNRELRQQLRVRDNVTGLVVLGITPGGQAAKARLRVGDIIVAANQRPTESLDALRQAIAATKAAKREYALLRVVRGTEAFFVTLPVGE